MSDVDSVSFEPRKNIIFDSFVISFQLGWNRFLTALQNPPNSTKTVCSYMRDTDLY